MDELIDQLIEQFACDVLNKQLLEEYTERLEQDFINQQI